MHIAYIYQFYATPSSYKGTRSYEFARRWIQAGHKVTVITSDVYLSKQELEQASYVRKGVRKLESEGVVVIILDVPYSQSMGPFQRVVAFLKFLWRATRTLLQLKEVDMVFATSMPLTVAVPALIGRYCRGLPFVFEIRDLPFRKFLSRGVIINKIVIGLMDRLEKKAYQKAEGVVALSPDMKKHVDSVTGDTAKTIVVSNCADTDFFKPASETEKAEIRRSLGWDGKFVIVHAGAMGKVNGLYRIVDLAPRFEGQPEICFVLLGEGKEKPYLEATVRDRNIKNVVFMDPIPKSQLMKILPAADAGLVSIDRVPRMQANSANKYFDCLACGIPVLLNYGGWQKEYLDRYKAGFGCDIFNDEEFVENILTLYRNPVLQKEMGENARKLAIDEFNRDRLAGKVLEFIEKCFIGTQKHLLRNGDHETNQLPKP